MSSQEFPVLADAALKRCFQNHDHKLPSKRRRQAPSILKLQRSLINAVRTAKTLPEKRDFIVAERADSTLREKLPEFESFLIDQLNKMSMMTGLPDTEFYTQKNSRASQNLDKLSAICEYFFDETDALLNQPLDLQPLNLALELGADDLMANVHMFANEYHEPLLLQQGKVQENWRHLIRNFAMVYVPRFEGGAPPLPADWEAGEALSMYNEETEGFVDNFNPPELSSVLSAIHHPFQPEIDKCLVKAEGPLLASLVKLPGEDRLHHYIDNLDDLLTWIHEVLTDMESGEIPYELAVDVEHHSKHSFYGFTCLIQVSTRKHNTIIDPLPHLFPHMKYLNRLMANPQILKVFHGAFHDIMWLQRDFSIFVVNMFDTFFGCRELKLEGGCSLANLIKHYCNVVVSKELQTCDWRQRPLTEDQKEYAYHDTHSLLYIYDRLLEDLRQTDNPALKIKRVLRSSHNSCLRLFSADTPDFQSMTDHLLQELGGARSRAPGDDDVTKSHLIRLIAWREFKCRLIDESLDEVCPNHLLYRLAWQVPKTLEQIQDVLKGTHVSGSFYPEILKALEKGLAAKPQKRVKYQAAPVEAPQPPLKVGELSACPEPIAAHAKLNFMAHQLTRK